MLEKKYWRTWLRTLCIAIFVLSGFTLARCVADTNLIPGGKVQATALKLLVDQPGLYRLSQEELKKAGLVVSQPGQLRLRLRNQPVPVRISTEGDDFSLVFYGEPSQSFYTHTNVYWLETSEAGGTVPVQMIEQEAAPVAEIASDSYQTRVMLEENRVFSPLADKDTPWFWVSMPAPRQFNVEAKLDAPTLAIGSVRVHVWASTQAPTDYDHHLRVLVNDVPILDQSWDGMGYQTLTGEIPAGILKNGLNSILLDAPGDSGAAADIVFLDWIELQYQQKGTVKEDRAFIEGQGNVVSITGFSSVTQVFDITDAGQPVIMVNLPGGEGSVKFLGERGHRYLAVGDQGYLIPRREAPVLQRDYHQESSGARYLVIGPSELLEPLSPLFALRQEQGLTTLPVPLQAVYDQFNDGFPEPEAIQSLVTFAQANWEVKPQYLLLVGDASYDPIGYISDSEVNRLPIFFISTEHGGLTGTDLPFVTGEDGRPLLAVGRIPARTPGEVRIWVEKTIQYEQSTQADWQNRALAIADGQEQEFQNDAQSFLDDVSIRYRGEIFSPKAGARDAAGKIQDFFAAGYGLISYFGHGSLNMWGKDRLFTDKDIAGLRNEHYPIVITVTCLNGFFIHPTTNSLAEVMLFKENGGAAAVLAPTSLTLPMDQAALGNALYSGLAAPEGRRLGDVLVSAQRQMPLETQGQKEVLSTFLLFGDPALRLPTDLGK